MGTPRSPSSMGPGAMSHSSPTRQTSSPTTPTGGETSSTRTLAHNPRNWERTNARGELNNRDLPLGSSADGVASPHRVRKKSANGQRCSTCTNGVWQARRVAIQEVAGHVALSVGGEAALAEDGLVAGHTLDRQRPLVRVHADDDALCLF